jgi:hypothetical protein
VGIDRMNAVGLRREAEDERLSAVEDVPAARIDQMSTVGLRRRCGGDVIVPVRAVGIDQRSTVGLRLLAVESQPRLPLVPDVRGN